MPLQELPDGDSGKTVKRGLTQKKNDASFHALSSGETQASFPASFKQEIGSCLSLTANNALFPVGVARNASFFLLRDKDGRSSFCHPYLCRD